MKNLVLTFLMLLGSTLAFAHGGEEDRITIEPVIQGPYNAGAIQYRFDIFDENSNRTVGENDLVESHTKKLHLVVYDASLIQFTHVHPTFDGNQWSADLNLPVNGTYFIWAQGQLQDGTEFSTYVKAQIQNGASEIQRLPLGDHRTNSDHGTVLTLDSTKVKAGKMVMINFEISREDGSAPELTPYLGAFAHVIAVPPDGDELIHVHPMAGNQPNTGMLHATFPREGDYRIWVQFNDKGELKTIPLSITVTK